MEAVTVIVSELLVAFAKQNNGQHYVCKASEEINIAPGVHCEKYCEAADQKMR